MVELLETSSRVTQLDDGRWRAEAPAKLNLGLRVYPPRADGFHDIESWFVPLSWHDTLTYTPGPPLEIVVTGRTEGIPVDPSQNLIGRAAIKLAEAAGVSPSARIELHKVLPPGGGLGGGSADAAMTLLALNEAWRLELDRCNLLNIAAQLGSDVPFFLQGQAALCTGRGEIVTPMRPVHPLFAVLIIPALGLATREVYRAFDAGGVSGNLPQINWPEYAASTARQLNERLVNDLEPAAFSIAPWLAELRDQASRACGLRVHMTGSGSTLFTLCDTGPAANDIFRRLTAELPGNTTCVPVRIL